MADTWIHFFLVENLFNKTFNEDEKIKIINTRSYNVLYSRLEIPYFYRNILNLLFEKINIKLLNMRLVTTSNKHITKKV